MASARRPKVAAMQRPEILSTYLKLGPVHSIGVHALHNLECPCRLHCGRGWLAVVGFASRKIQLPISPPDSVVGWRLLPRSRIDRMTVEHQPHALMDPD